MGGLTLAVSILLALLVIGVNAVSSQLTIIQGHTAKIAALEPLQKDFRDFRSEVNKSFDNSDDRMLELTRKVASLESLPQRVSEVAAGVESAKTAAAQSAQQIKVALDGIKTPTQELGDIQKALVQTQKQLDQVKVIADAVNETRAAVDRIAKGTSHATSLVRVRLREGVDMEPVGRFKRVRVVIPTEEIPILTEPKALAGAAIVAVEIERTEPLKMIGPVTVRAQLDREEGQLHLILWYVDEKLPPLRDHYALVSVSLPDDPRE